MLVVKLKNCCWQQCTMFEEHFYYCNGYNCIGVFSEVFCSQSSLDVGIEYSSPWSG